MFNDFTMSIQWVDFDFRINSSACKTLKPRNNSDLRYIYYTMKKIHLDATQHMHYWIIMYSNINIDYPKTEIRKHIVDMLDVIYFDYCYHSF